MTLVGRLDNRDKHRILLTGVGAAPFRQPKFKGLMSANGTYPYEWVHLADGAELYRLTEYDVLPGVTNIEIIEGPVYTLAFGDPALDVEGVWQDRTKAATTKELAVYADRIETLLGRLEAAV